MATNLRIDVRLCLNGLHFSRSDGPTRRIYVSIHPVTEDLVRDSYGIETVVATWVSHSYMFPLDIWSFCPDHIYGLLSHHLPNPQVCEYLATVISQGASRATQMGLGLSNTTLSVRATLTQQRISFLAPPSPSSSSSSSSSSRVSAELAMDGKSLKDLGLESETCSICLVEFSDSDKDITQTPCSHVFHRDCVFEWLRRKNSCPLCRQGIV